MRRVVTVVGARPQFVKAAVVSRSLRRHGGVEEVLVHTGQHVDAELSATFFKELEIPSPAWNLGICGGGHGQMTGRMLEAVERVLHEERPDVVVVYGDTNSTLAGALAAAKLHIPVAHVEAGLRSFKRAMPEEVNRVVVDHVSDLLLCPTRTAVDNLEREGITANVHQVGDVMYDAALEARRRAGGSATTRQSLGLGAGPFAVATIHRAENTDDPRRLADILAYLRAEAAALPVVLCLHPRTREAARRAGLSLDGLRVRGPVGYLEMVRLLREATRVYTDSGGLQKEAYFHRVECVTLREETEWVETVEAGWNHLWRQQGYRPRREITDYGDGHAGDRVAELLCALL
jgi:UDP-GlcNAc3NAcA epimerase